MRLSAVSIGVGAYNLISQLMGEVGYISSVFKRTFHIKTLNEGIISVVNKSVGNGPLNIIVEIPTYMTMDKLGITCGTPVKKKTMI